MRVNWERVLAASVLSAVTVGTYALAHYVMGLDDVLSAVLALSVPLAQLEWEALQ